jgi:hypothetical protein
LDDRTLVIRRHTSYVVAVVAVVFVVRWGLGRLEGWKVGRLEGWKPVVEVVENGGVEMAL